MIHTLRYVSSIKYPSLSFDATEGVCAACGADATYQYFDVINDRLANEWGVDKKLKDAYSTRESMHCSSCRCSARLRAQAKAMCLVYSPESKSIKEAIKKGVFKGKKVAEINSCGDLHTIIEGITKGYYSEFESDDKSIRNEDLQNLSYKDKTFDLILTSDTLEHIPDYNKALSEINRVLKVGGHHIFTVPLIFSRKTRRRVAVHADGVKNILEPSYHGAGEAGNLVSSEFGIDFLKELKRAKFKTDIYFGSPINKNKVNYVFVSKKVSK